MQTKPYREQIDQCIIQIVTEKKPKTVSQLVRLVRQSYPLFSKQEITEQVLRLQKQRKLILREYSTPFPSELKGYVFSKMATWYWVIVALASATLTLIFTFPEDVYPIIYARYLFGSIFILWLPGYSLIKAFFPTKELDNIERIALSLGMSLAIVPITGLFLNYTPWGIRVMSVTLSLLALTLTFATAAIIREHRVRLKAE